MVEKLQHFIQEKLGPNYLVYINQKGMRNEEIVIVGKKSNNAKYIKSKVAYILGVSTLYLEDAGNHRFENGYKKSIRINNYDLGCILRQETNFKKEMKKNLEIR